MNELQIRRQKGMTLGKKHCVGPGKKNYQEQTNSGKEEICGFPGFAKYFQVFPEPEWTKLETSISQSGSLMTESLECLLKKYTFGLHPRKTESDFLGPDDLHYLKNKKQKTQAP